MNRWIKLLFSVLAIYGFMIWAPKLLTQIEIYQKIEENSERMGIDNSTIFYSDEPISYEAAEVIGEKLNVK